MRLAVLVVSMLVAIWIYVDALRMIATGRPEGIDLGGGGVLSSLLCALAALMVFPQPLGATMLFGVGTLVSLVVATRGHPDHYLFGSTMAALAAMSLWAWLSAQSPSGSTRRTSTATCARCSDGEP